MAAPVNALKKALSSFITKEEIRQIAAETGFVKRVRNLDVVKFLWAVILSFGIEGERSFVQIQRVYEMITGDKTLNRSSFHERFNEYCALFMKAVFTTICVRMSKPKNPIENLLKQFADIILIDSTFLRVHDSLEDIYPSIGRNRGKEKMKAEVKLQVTISATSNAPHMVKLSPGKEHEKHGVQMGEWVKDKLILADRGFFSYDHFFAIDSNGGFFISRLITSFNPFAVDDYIPEQPSPVLQLGNRMKEIIKDMEKTRESDVIDLKVMIGVKRPTSVKVRGFLRVVCIWNPKTNSYSSYLTNIPAHMMTPEDIARSYRVRWEIEMIFKELKSYFRLDQIPSKKPECVVIFIYAALLSFILSRHILNTIREVRGIPASKSPERLFAKLFTAICSDLLHDMFHPHACMRDWNEHEKYLLKWIKPSNNKRPDNLSVARN